MDDLVTEHNAAAGADLPPRAAARPGDPRLTIALRPSRWAVPRNEEATVSSNVYGVTEIVGTSTNGIEDAIDNGIARASTTLRGLNWFEVTEVRGHIADGQVAHYQVGMKVGFRMDA